MSIVIPATEIVAEATMIAAGDAVTLVVEGASDELLLSGILDQNRFTVVPAGSKEAALGVVRLLADNAEDDRRVGHLIVIVDRDMGSRPGRDGRLLVTHACDLDAELCSVQGVVARLVRASQRLVRNEEVEIVVSRILDAAHVYRSVREVNSEMGLGLAVEKLRREKLGVSLMSAHDIASALLGESEHLATLEKRVDEKLSQEKSFMCCRGHDVHFLISVGSKHHGQERIQDMAIAMLDPQAFAAMPTGAELIAWANEIGFPLLKAA